MEKALALAAALFAGSPQSAQEPPQAAVFRSGVTLRSVFASVTDRSGKPVEGLAKEAFSLTEGGAAREISYFVPSGERVPVDAVLLIDSSASMDENLPHAEDAALAFIDALEPGDRVQIVDVDSRVEAMTEMTSDRLVLREAVKGLSAGGSTALHNGLYMALKHLVKPAEGRQSVVICLTDGEDTSSLVGFDEVVALARETSASVYGVTPGGESERELRRLAIETGGRVAVAKNFKALAGIYKLLASELSSKYLIGFYPADEKAPGRVTVSVPGRPDLSVRYSRGGAL